jgi:two-component sensor histidine kinase
VLLKEIHHRVKNNLQVVSSLLDFQSEYIKDQLTLDLFKESQNRVTSMALVHEQLYQSKDLARIDFAEYIRDLTEYLFHSYGANWKAITPKIHVDDVPLSVDTAIPCGLIINELVSNSLKHAFPAAKARSQQGEILVALHSNNAKLTLIVSDNGVGFPKDLDFLNTETLGLRLVNMLNRQLKGTIELDRSGGTAFKITFATPKPQGRT